MHYSELLVVDLRQNSAGSAAGGMAFAGGVDVALTGGVFMPVANYYAAYLLGWVEVDSYAVITVGVFLYYPLVSHQVAQAVEDIMALLAFFVYALDHAVGRIVDVLLFDFVFRGVAEFFVVDAFYQIAALVEAVTVVVFIVGQFPNLLVEAIVPVFVALIRAIGILLIE